MQYKIIVHRLFCDICEADSIEDAGEVSYAKDRRNWVKECGWGYHNKNVTGKLKWTVFGKQFSLPYIQKTAE